MYINVNQENEKYISNNLDFFYGEKKKIFVVFRKTKRKKQREITLVEI